MNGKIRLITYGEETSKAMQEVAEKECDKLIEMTGDSLQDIEIVCKVRNDGRNKVELNVNTSDGLFRKEMSSESFYNVLPELTKKVELQIRDYKDKRNDTFKKRRRERKKNLRKIEPLFLEDQEYLQEEDLYNKEKSIKVKTVDLKPMFTEDAIFEMDAVDHNFFLYIDGETFKPSVIYKKNDGGYGILRLDTEIK